jgi:hypothetical protein
MQEPGPGPSFKLFHPIAVGGITFLGGPLAGSIALAMNFRRMGNTGAAWISLICGLVATAVAIAFGFATQNDTSSASMLLLPLMFMAIASVVANKYQKDFYQKHLESGGKRVSIWTAIGVTVGGVALTFAAIIPLALLLTDDDLTKDSHIDATQTEQVYYSGNVTKEEAQGVGEALKKTGYFSGTRVGTVRVKRTGKNAVISFVTSEVGWTDPKMEAAFQAVVKEISPAVGGLPIVVRLVDKDLVVKKEFEVK